MPFRGVEQQDGAYVPRDPYGRFAELASVLEEGRGFMGERTSLRLAAMTLLTTPGAPRDLVGALRAKDRELGEHFGWMSEVSAPVRLLLASLLVKYGDEPEAFVAETERVRGMMKAVNLRRGRIYDFFVTLILRRIRRGAPVESADIERLAALYEQMKRYHWWLTGPEDLPACAMLTAQPGAAAAIGDRIESIYQALDGDAGLSTGDPLQTAANILYLTGLEPAEIAQRFSRLTAALKHGGQSVGQREYDEVASLCFLSLPVERIATTVLGFRDRLLSELASLSKPLAFSLASALAFVYLTGQDERMKQLGDLKVLLDMQAIVAAQQAAISVVVVTAS